MSKYYTRLGDEGLTHLLGKGKVPKYHPRPEALGAVDEANAVLGFARAETQNESIKTALLQVQRHLYLLMAELAATPENAEKVERLSHQQVQWLEDQIDAYSEKFPPVKEFVLPGDSLQSAVFGLARTAVRRAERRVCALSFLGEINNPHVLAYLNRLSSFCFVLELYVINVDLPIKPSVTKEK